MSTMLPSPPKSLGRLSDVLTSALASVQGLDNPLKLEKRKSVVVVMVDGLGYANLSRAGGHAPFLNLSPKEKLSCYFPATTSTSISSLATGLAPWDTGFTGYLMFDRDQYRIMNMLTGWEDVDSAHRFQSNPTLAELTQQVGVKFHVISQAEYENTGFTAATMRGGEFHAVNLITDRFEEAIRILSYAESSVSYLYVPILDQIAHQFGVESLNWLHALEDFDSIVRDTVSRLPKNTAMILISDHGIVDVPKSNHVYIDEIFPDELFAAVVGDTRALQLFLADGIDLNELKTSLQENYGELCYVVTTEELIEAGYWQRTELLERWKPDLLLMAKKQVALYHRGFAKAKSLRMIGHHGSISDQELSIPLIKFGY